MRKLVRGPVFRSLIALSLVYVGTLYVFPTAFNEVWDAIAIGACIALLVRYGPAAWYSARKADPTSEDEWLVGGVVVALSILMLRTLRLIGIEFGVINKYPVAVAFGAITMVMVYGIALKTIALPFAERRLTPYATLPVAFFSGAVFVGALFLMRWVF